ncbi:helix-turn-helix transcriptional regulator [Streptomyces sp. NPDC051993]|uniref:helix-turn-helix domain-containing protein n=1 Tax=Streptomyces sp. NPDC051993 TaxID=3155286 RepID=UPI0034465753
MPPRDPGRGRPADYCGQACRQAAYRERHKKRDVPLTGSADAASPPSETSPVRQELLELSLNIQSDLRHLIRLMTPGPQPSAVECVELAAQIQQRMQTLLSGTVVLARERRIAWEVLGTALNLSPETARRVYHRGNFQRRLHMEAPTSKPLQAIDDVDVAGESATSPPAPPLEQAPAPPSVRTSRRAANQLAPILSRLLRESRLSVRQLSLRTQVSASYLSRVLSGEKLPTWELTERVALALGADSEALHKVWSDERNRDAARRAGHDPGDDLASTLDPFHSALRSLSRMAGRPSSSRLRTVIGNVLTEREISAVLRGDLIPDWDHTQQLILAMDGEPTFFRPLWERARYQVEAAGPQPAATPEVRVNRLLTVFGEVLNSVDDQRAVRTTRRARAIRQRLAITRTT